MLFKWARSEAEAITLQSDGWTVARQGFTHHHDYALLLQKEERPPSDGRPVDEGKRVGSGDYTTDSGEVTRDS